MFSFINIAHAAISFPDFSQVQDIPTLIGQIYEYSLTIVGLVIFIRFLYGGWLYLTAAGGVGKADKAKNIMTNAVIGAVILFSAYLILYVINPDLVKNTFNFGVPTATK